MLFPDSERVIYQKNPLVQVTCQLRFPAILRIDSELPAPFQERIRDQYPIFREKTAGSDRIPQELVQQLPPAIVKSVQSLFDTGNKVYEFAADDDRWIVSLARDFLALTANEYERWEQFREHLRVPFQALKDIYSPAFFSRVGLRYQNVIQRSKLGLVESHWTDLINPYIAGELAAPEIATAIQEVVRVTLIDLGDRQSQVRIQHGLAKNNETGEICYMIDNDFFAQPRIEVDNGFDLLESFNNTNRRLFRWCITDKLHRAMEPSGSI